MQKYNSKKDKIYGVVIWGSILLIFFLTVIIPLLREHKITSVSIILALVIFFPTAIMLGWIWYGTYYVLADDYIDYASGPIKGKINISKIRKIYKKAAPWVGLKPVLSYDSMLIVFNKYEEIYLSPENKEAFIKEILDKNPEVEIIEKN